VTPYNLKEIDLVKHNSSNMKTSSSSGHRSANNLRVRVLSDPPGVVEMPALPNAIVSIHMGPSTRMHCRHGGESYRGTAIHGDIDIIHWGTPGRWELKEKDAALVLSLAPELLRAAAEERGLDASRLEMQNRFQARDAQLEHMGWALKSEMERGYPCGRLYLDSLAMALAVHLVQNHSSLSCPRLAVNGKMPAAKLKQVLLFIEDNLSEDLSLADIAEVAGLSVSHCKTLFRASVGLSIHQYVIRRRVERAASLLQESNLSISQVALETGFAHQSHLAMHMRRLLGTSPKMMLRTNLQ
jgi:AraC family transcriptional regulator